MGKGEDWTEGEVLSLELKWKMSRWHLIMGGEEKLGWGADIVNSFPCHSEVNLETSN